MVVGAQSLVGRSVWRSESDQGRAGFGGAVAAAGDVNGDGFDDVLVGAWQARRASVFLGSAQGLEASASWTVTGSDFDFGWSVASAGDVNGDGYGDVVVGAPRWSNGEGDEGRVFVYLGTPRRRLP